MRNLIPLAAWLLTLNAAQAEDNKSDIEDQALRGMLACYQVERIHELVPKMNEDEFVQTVMGEICREQRKQAAQDLADGLESKGLPTDEIKVRVGSFLLGHTTTLRMFYRRIKGAQ